MVIEVTVESDVCPVTDVTLRPGPPVIVESDGVLPVPDLTVVELMVVGFETPVLLPVCELSETLVV